MIGHLFVSGTNFAWVNDTEEEKDEQQQNEEAQRGPPVRAMAELPRKIYQEARQKAAALRRTQSGSKKNNHQRNQGSPNLGGIDVPKLSSSTKEHQEDSLEALLASAPLPMDIPGYMMVPLETSPPSVNETPPVGASATPVANSQ